MEKGDVLLLANMSMAHGRMWFEGEHQTLAGAISAKEFVLINVSPSSVNIFTGMKKAVKMKLYLVVLLLMIQTSVYCQISFDGIVVDKKTNEFLPYVNIGVINKQVGTVSNSSGHFSLDVPEHLVNDSIRFSYVGYRPYTVQVGFFLNKKGKSLKIELVESPIEPKSVVISSTQLKRRVFGVKSSFSHNHSATSFNGFQKGPVEDILGSEMGMIIKPKKYPSSLIDFNFYIKDNDFDSLKLRINIYPLKRNVLQDNVAPTNIIIDVVNKQKGWIKVNLQPYNIVAQSEFLISLECVYYKGVAEKDVILIPTFYPSFSTVYQKYTSQDKWLIEFFELSFNVTLEY